MHCLSLFFAYRHHLTVRHCSTRTGAACRLPKASENWPMLMPQELSSAWELHSEPHFHPVPQVLFVCGEPDESKYRAEALMFHGTFVSHVWGTESDTAPLGQARCPNAARSRLQELLSTSFVRSHADKAHFPLPVQMC